MVGSLLIYRANIPETELIKTTGIPESAVSKDGFAKYGRGHIIFLNLKGIKKSYGIYAGTKEQSTRKEKALNLILNKEYTFFTDDSVQSAPLTNKIIKN